VEKQNQKISKGIVNGDTKTIKAFYRHNYQGVRKMILQHSGREEDVDDTFQEALVFLFQKLQQEHFVLESSIHAYFYGVCKNMWRNQLRKKRRFATAYPLERKLADTSDIMETFEQQERQRLYQKYVLKLNSSQKKVLDHFFEGKSMQEIANLMGYTEAYARKKKFKTKEQLMAMIERDPLYREIANRDSRRYFQKVKPLRKLIA